LARAAWGVFVGIVFEIDVLDHDHVAGGGGETGAKRGAFALVYVMVDQAIHLRSDLGFQQIAGVVREQSSTMVRIVRASW